ncbi:DUF1330 domain-containing protein [Hoyosella sp. YIM 151337]|uniref:DUF1330 domain-containing protein n=1 Tax=Hoyosella sp. YIM 151337 TaxID=2992742 RepID=UPI0022360B8E|nr:DUF1330 domain-containing protein [Hoyosella sp. YIM 151337]MCW4351750.1 DUF1330 domain-containing protein [Hoyosella sp. YIM 151337]
MTPRAYAIAYLREVTFGPDIVAYLERIDATLKPFGGKFIVHGGSLSPLEGEWNGDVIIIEFPDKKSAQEWYASPDYQSILPLRTANSQGVTAVVEGVPEDYRAVDKLAQHD